jgi:hypothetical protein
MTAKFWRLSVGFVLALAGVSFAQTKKEVSTEGAINAFPDCTSLDRNLVTNCGFETGDFTGWTLAGDLSPYVTVTTDAAHSGTYAAHLGPVNYVGLMTQVLPTAAGQVCELSFWIRNNGLPSTFDLRFGPLQVSPTDANFVPALHSVIENVPNTIYTQYTYAGLVASGATTLNFTFNNSPSFTDLDDIVVVCSP